MPILLVYDDRTGFQRVYIHKPYLFCQVATAPEYLRTRRVGDYRIRVFINLTYRKYS